MIGGLLRLGVQMASYVASQKLVSQGARWLSDGFRKGVRSLASYASRRPENYSYLKSMAFKRTKEGWSADKGIIKRYDDLKDRMIRGTRNRAQMYLSKKQFDRAGRIARVAQDEIHFMPANYVMYRVEKNAAVSPEEKEMTKSFTKYYMGAPMIMSMVSGSAMYNAKNYGKSMTRFLQRKISPQRQAKMLKSSARMFTGAAHVINQVSNFAAAAAIARNRMTEGRAMHTLIGRYSLREFASAVPDHFRAGLREARRPRKTTLKMLDEQVAKFRTHMEERVAGHLKGDVRSKKAKTGQMSAQERDIRNLIGRTEREVYTSYKKSMKKTSGIMNFYNKIVRNVRNQLGEQAKDLKEIRRATKKRRIDGKVMDIPEGPGIYNVGGKRTDFGRLSMSYIKDSLIRGSQRGVSNFVIRLFGMREVVDYRQTSHSLGLAFGATGKGKLFMPMSFYDESILYQGSLEEQARLTMRKMISADSDEAATAFFDDRARQYMKRSELGKITSIDNAHTAAYLSAAHGELLLKSDDVIVHMPGGGMKLLSNVDINGKKTMQSFRLGGEGYDGIEFLKYTSDTKSITSRLIRSFLGHHNYNIGAGNYLSAGPVPIGQVEGIKEAAGFWANMKKSLEIGKSQERSIFSKGMTVFKKHTDPRYPTTLYTNRYLKNMDHINEVVNDSEFRALGDMIDTIGNHSKQAADEFYMSLINKTKGTDEIVSLFNEMSRHMKVDVAEYMLTPQMSISSGNDIANMFLDEFTAKTQYKLSKGSFLRAEYKDVSRIKEVIHVGEVDTIIDLMGRHGSGRKQFSKGMYRELNLMDAYNSSVFRLMIGVNQSERGAVNSMSNIFRNIGMNEKEISAFMTASHLSKMHHALSKEYADMAGHLDARGLVAARGRIKDIITSMTGSAEYDDVLKYYSTRKKFAPYMPADFDQRIKVEPPAYNEIFVVPKTSGAGIITKRNVEILGDTVPIAQGMMGAAGITTMSLFHAFNRAASEFLGIGLDEMATSTPGQYFKKMATKRVLPAIGLYMGYSVADRMADRYLEGTPLGEGLTVFGANVLAGARIAAQGALDFTGVTDVSKYAEDLMPGIITSPLSGLVRATGPIAVGMSLGMKAAGPGGALMGGIVGSAIGMLAGGGPLGAFGMWDISKHRGQVIEELTGQREVAIRKGRWWELGSTPFAGTRTEYFRPHIYALTRSKYKETPGYKDSIFTDVVGTIAPDLYLAKNYYSRPYPTTSGLFSNIPVFSTMLNSLPGSSYLTGSGIPIRGEDMSPTYMMHQAREMGIPTTDVASSFVNRSGMFGDTVGSAGGFDTTEPSMGSDLYDSAYMAPDPITRGSTVWNLGESIMNVQDIVGLRGFMLSSVYGNMTGRRDLFDYAPELASPTDIGGFRREYWDLELGGIMGASEIIRRYIPHRRNQMQVYNPIRNTMPKWLPGHDYFIDFRHGDPYTNVVMGEARLPGAGYESLRDVDLAFPIEAEILGMEQESQIAQFLGFPEHVAYMNKMEDMIEPIKQEIVDGAKRYGDLVRATTSVYNANYDLHATADALLQTMTGEKAAIKVVPKGFAGESSLNAFMILSDIDKGILLEVDPEQGGVVEKLVTKDIQKFQSELQSAQRAAVSSYNQIAELSDNGKAMNLANAYSWFDRYRILADVAPYSSEFKEADAIVKQQMTAGTLDPAHVGEYYQTKDQIDEKTKAMDFQEYRFSNIGEALTPYGQAKDKFYQSEYNFLERTVGSMWERVSHMRTPIHSKLLHHSSALEEYERTSIYGKRIKMWERPIEDFAKSYYYQMKAETDPLQAVASWGMGGLLIGGTPLAGAMALGGLVNAGIQTLRGETFIPERVQKRREIVEQMDAVKYAKYQKLYAETGDRSYLAKAGRTITGASMKGTVLSPRSVGQYLGSPEKDFVQDIMNNVTLSNVQRVAEILPEPAVATMYKMIGEQNIARGIMQGRVQENMTERNLPGFDSSIYSAGVPIETPAIQTFEMEGLDAHDAGMGWYDQVASMERSQRAGIWGEEGLYGDLDTRVNVMDFAGGIGDKGTIRKLLMPISSNVSIMDDGWDRVDLEVIVR